MKLRLILNYCGHGRKFGVIHFRNGFTLRAWRVALHVWRCSPLDIAR